jgi:hypothetical protein
MSAAYIKFHSLRIYYGDIFSRKFELYDMCVLKGKVSSSLSFHSNIMAEIFSKLCRIRLVYNPLNVELNTICHLLVLLRDLTFMGLCIVSIFQYISNKM